MDNETVETAESESDMRADLNAAIAGYEAPEEEDAPSEEAEADLEIAPEEAQVQPSPDAEPAPAAEGKDGGPEAGDKETTPPTAKSEVKPPIGWDAEQREQWSQVPEKVKMAVAEREREIAVTMQQTAEERRVARNFSETMTKYRAPMQGMGFNDPMDAVNTIMGAAAQMSTGSAQQRAAATAKIIKDFGIDIGELDNALSGEAAAAPTNDIEALLDQRLAPVNNMMTQIEQQREQQAYQQQLSAGAEVTEFMGGKEFSSDVRLDMADILDLAAKRGHNMSLEDAYNRACMLNPTVANVLKERGQQSAAAKRTAASSVSGGPAGSGSNKTPATISEALNAAWDAQIR